MKMSAKVKFQLAMLAVMVGLGCFDVAHATPAAEFELPELPMTQIYTLGGTVLSGLAVLWGYRKLVKSTNRS